jgi:hypothetical protein
LRAAEIKVAAARRDGARAWEEALYLEDGARHQRHRDEIEGKFFCTAWAKQDGVGDVFPSRRRREPTYTPFGGNAGATSKSASKPKTKPSRSKTFACAKRVIPRTGSQVFQ